MSIYDNYHHLFTVLCFYYRYFRILKWQLIYLSDSDIYPVFRDKNIYLGEKSLQWYFKIFKNYFETTAKSTYTIISVLCFQFWHIDLQQRVWTGRMVMRWLTYGEWLWVQIIPDRTLIFHLRNCVVKKFIGTQKCQKWIALRVVSIFKYDILAYLTKCQLLE